MGGLSAQRSQEWSKGEGKIGLREGGGVVGAPRRRGGGSGNGAPVTEPLVKYLSPRREVQAWASYTPLFWGHSRSIPQGIRRIQAMWMHIPTATSHGRMVAQAAAVFVVDGSNPCQADAIGGAACMCA